MGDQMLFPIEPSQSTPLPPPARNLLTLVFETGRFWFSPPEGPTTRLSVTEESSLYPLDDCAVEAGLRNRLQDGWWLCGARLTDPPRQTWTWVSR